MDRRRFLVGSAATITGVPAVTELVSRVYSMEAPDMSGSEPTEALLARDAENWSFYPSDEFDTSYLRRRWLIRNTKVSLSNGRVILSNENGNMGAILLKGCYDNRSASGEGGRPKVYLRWPWAVETRLILPPLPKPETPFCAQLGLTLCNERGFQAPVNISRAGGFGANWLGYRVEGKADNRWIEDPQVMASSDLYLRIEALGNDGRGIRCGVRNHTDAPWTWSETCELTQSPTWAEEMGLFNGNVQKSGLEVTGDIVTLEFDYVRLEGESFKFPKPGPVGFIRQVVEGPGVGKVVGKRFEAQVPDTLDVAERCALALNALTGCADPTAEYEIHVMALTNPAGWSCYDLNYYNPDVESGLPIMVHDFGDDWEGPNVVQAIPLMRIASGSDLNLETGEGMLQWLRRMIGDDGLVYHPVKGRPWALFAFSGVDPFGAEAQSGQVPDLKIGLAGYTPGEMMLALGSWYTVTQDPALLADMKRMAEGLRTKTNTPEWARAVHPISEGALIQGLAKCYRMTGYEPARDLCADLIRHFRTAYYGEDGTFKVSHFHTSVFGLLAMNEYAQAVGDGDLLKLVARAYEYGRTKGWPLVGFFPEGVGQRPATCESCETAEMTALAALLSAEGVGDYWDDADQYLRNQFSENQLLNPEWIDEMVGSDPHPPVTRFSTDATREVAKRLVGWFTSYSSANSWFMDFPRAPGPVACCLGNGSRGLYYVWEHMVTYSPGTLRVNLLLNRASKWADVDSHIPYLGQVDVRVKEALRLLVRVPTWVADRQVTCKVNGHAKSLQWEGRYVSPGGVKRGDVVTVSFPLEERTVEQKIGEEHCRLILKGSTVVAIEPRAQRYPYYQRAAYRENQTRFKRTERFVADNEVNW